MVSEQAGNEEIGIALQKSFQTTVGDDFDFALVQLSVLGELRAENSIPFFTEILTRKVRDGTRDLEHAPNEANDLASRGRETSVWFRECIR